MGGRFRTATFVACAIVALPPAFYEVLIIGPAAEFARRWLDGVPGLDVDVTMRVLPETVWRSIAAEEA